MWLQKPMLLLALTLLVLTGCTGGTVPAAGLPRGVVARVGSQEIRQDQLDLRARIFELYFQEPMHALPTRSQLLDQLVEEKLLVAEAQKQNLKVDEAQINRELQLFLAALAERYQGEEAVAKRLRELQLSNAQLRTFLSEFLLAQQVAEQYRNGVQLSGDEVRQFYEQNKNSLYTFAEPVVRARHILLPEAREARARELARRARDGEDFSALAREYSTDPGSGRLGGDLGYFRKSDMVPEFAELAFSLAAGAVGGPVRSRFGWHVIKVDDRRGPGVIPFELAQSDIVNKLRPARQNEALARWIEGLKQAVAVQKGDLAAATKAK